MTLSFDKWMIHSGLKDSTAKAYANVVKITAFDMAKEAGIVSTPLIVITDQAEFDSIASQIVALTEFKEKNTKRNNILSAAISKYSEYLGSLAGSPNPSEGLLTAGQKERLLETFHELREAGGVSSPEQLEFFYSNFRDKFGPEILRGLDGEQLLYLMHETGTKEAMTYWLEFKDDDEFPTYKFGSISGGSAMKFRLFKRKETGIWQAADASNTIIDIGLDDAVEMARLHRDELLRGVNLLEQLPLGACDEEYAQLQVDMEEEVPTIHHLGWAHKYFCLLFPDKLDEFHSELLQKYHLIKLLQSPSAVNGKYACAGRFVTMAKELGLPMVTFDKVLNKCFGSRHSYWRVGTRAGTSGESHWEMMKENDRLAIGWGSLGDLSWLEGNKQSRDKLKEMLSEDSSKSPQSIGNVASQIIKFVDRIKEGDIVWAADGATVLGIGRVKNNEYHFESGLDFPHQREVEWLNLDEWQTPQSEGLRTTVHQIKKHVENLLETERRIQNASPIKKQMTKTVNSPIKGKLQLDGVAGRIQSILDRKKQVILYGPPGTGKTFWAERATKDLAAYRRFSKRFDELDQVEQESITGNDRELGYVRICCFHPSYGYEDFVEGFRPSAKNDALAFKCEPGVFKQMCEDAAQEPDHDFFLIVDEINRGYIPRIFGELLTVLEKDKRSKPIILPISKEKFVVPQNVFIVGTMNTADRSISLLDAALRRRFGFIELMPDSSVLKDHSVSGVPLAPWFDALNQRIREHVGRDARNLQIGHSYLLHNGQPLKDLSALGRVLRDDIIPLIEEYCYEDYSSLQSILGKSLVDGEKQVINQSLFDRNSSEQLVAALLQPCPEISSSTDALISEESIADQDDEDEDGDE